MSYRKCHNCGAPLDRGKTLCSYCGTDVESGAMYRPIKPGDRAPSVPVAPPIVPGRTPRVETHAENSTPDAARIGRVIVFFLLLFACGPAALVYMWMKLDWRKGTKGIVTAVLMIPVVFVGTWGFFHETVYAIKSVTEPYAPDAPDWGARRHEPIDHGIVFTDIRDDGGRDRDELRRLWDERYEGRWVRWALRIKQKNIYTTMASELVLSPESEAYEVEVFFDPAKNAALEALVVGDEVTVSGRLWGYYWLTNRMRLADGELAP
ncbi:MAG: zinc-ribbon domain-containing protein [Deltaproteobacteria bacterium]|nr:zinc-ribbon domain-containing protein [Deltaproteobacteria bacterium]